MYSLMIYRSNFERNRFITLMPFKWLLPIIYVLVTYKTRFNHWLHLHNFSPLCVLWWQIKSTFWTKLLSYSSHLNSFSQMCVFWWNVNLLLRTKVLSQWSHLNGFSPLCVIWWHTRLLLQETFTSLVTKTAFPLHSSYILHGCVMRLIDDHHAPWARVGLMRP